MNQPPSPNYQPASAHSSPARVVVTDVDMPFFSMMMFMVKWALASIPAALIIFTVFGMLGAFAAMVIAAAGIGLHGTH